MSSWKHHAAAVALTALLAASLVTAQAVASKAAATPAVPSTAAARVPGGLRLDRLEHDFGRVRDEKKVETTIGFVNAGNRAITIREIKVQCACVSGKIVKPESKVCEPGALGEIKLVFDPAYRQGQDRKTVSILTDDPENPQIDIKVKIEVIPRIGIVPRALYIGEYKRGVPSPAKQIVITSRLEGVEIEAITVENPRFEWRRVSSEETVVDGVPATKMTYEVKFKGGDKLERVQSHATIKTSDSRKMPTLHVPLIADVIGDLRIVPDKLYLRLDGSGKPWTQSILVQSRSRTPFNITQLAIKGQEDLQLTVVKEVDDRMPATYRVKVSGANPPRAASEAQVEGELLLATDAKEQPPQVIPIQGHVQPTVPEKPAPTGKAPATPSGK